MLSVLQARYLRALLALPLLLGSVLSAAQSAAAAPPPSGVHQLSPATPGVLTAFNGAGAGTASIYLSPDGTHLGGGGNTSVEFNGDLATALIRYGAGTIAAFASGSIYFSPDGYNLHGRGNSQLVYGGTQQVLGMTAFRGGVLTAFTGGSIYFSPDGTHLGGGGSTTVPYRGEHVTAMIAYQQGVITAFESGQIYYSVAGQGLHGGTNTQLVYAGNQLVRAMSLSVDLPRGPRPPDLTVVPDCVGQSESTCWFWLVGNGLMMGTLSFRGSIGSPPYTIIVVDQSPAAGTVVQWGASVDLTIQPQGA